LNLKEKTLLVWDAGGLGADHAAALAPYYGETIYFNPYQRAFCESADYFVGRGFEGVRKTLYFWD
jgi:hypothetical protein